MLTGLPRILELSRALALASAFASGVGLGWGCPGPTEPARTNSPRRVADPTPEAPKTDLGFVTHHRRLGVAAWRKACPETPVDGICAHSNSAYPRFILAARTTAGAATAQQHFHSVWIRWRRVMGSPKATDPAKRGELLSLRELAAEALFMSFEGELEAYLGRSVPQNLDFDPAHPTNTRKSMVRFKIYLKAKLKGAAALVAKYLTVITTVRIEVDGKRRGSPAWSVAAMARSALVFHHFAQELDNTPPPKFIKDAAIRQAYRDTLERFSAPLLAKAHQRYALCVRLAASFKVPDTNPWVRLCKRELPRTKR